MRKTIVLYPATSGGFVSMGRRAVRPERVRFAALPAGRALPRSTTEDDLDGRGGGMTQIAHRERAAEAA